MRRTLLGAALALLVIPLIYVAKPDLFEGLLVRITGSETTGIDLEEMVTKAAGPVQPGDKPHDRGNESDEDMAGALAETDLEPPSPAPEVTTAASTEHEHHPPPTEGPTPTQPAPPKVVELTGDVAGTFAADTKLVGKVNLVGDLIVDGATLAAGPGVDVQGNGFQIMIHNGGRADWRGTPVFTWSGDGSNANLSRDINFRNMRRIMFMGGAGPSVIKYVAVHSSGTPKLGDYPLHWHLNGDSTRGTLVEGVAVIDGKHHAFVPHASHGITFRDTIAWQIQGGAYWWDPPPKDGSPRDINNSRDILYEHVLADGITNGPGDDRGYRAAAFALMGGDNNTLRDSVARNIHPSHKKDCSGFIWPSIGDQSSLWTFENNKTFLADCFGIFVWDNDQKSHVIDGFVSTEGISHGAYINHYEYRNIDVPYVLVHAVGWSVTSGSIGEVRDTKHQSEGTVTFTDVQVGRLIVDHVHGQNPAPIHYVFTNTGLTCDDVEWVSWVEGSTITIDGQDCPPSTE